MDNVKSLVLQRLKGLRREHIVMSEYAQRRAAFRQVDLEDVIDNLLNPIRLQWAERQLVDGEERHNCFFVYKRRALRCIVKFNGSNVKVINVIKPKKWPV